MDSRQIIQLGLFHSRVSAICEEMGALLGRTALSPNIRDRLDYSCALFDQAGELLGQATHIPVHLGSMAYAMKTLIDAHDWHAGDMLVVNDPFQGGTHLPDITFVAPAFINGVLVGFVANRAHHADIGADAPGSMPVSCSLEEEGVLISPTLIRRNGEWDQPVLNGILQQLRDGQAALSDFKAQAGANRLGVQRIAALAAEFGVDAFANQCVALQNYAERLARTALADIPPGRYTFSDVMDDDGAGTQDIVLRVAIDVGENGMVLDFTGTSEQVSGNLNCPMAVTAAAAFYVFRCLMPPQIPACSGAMRPYRLNAQAGSLINARYPAAVAAGNVETSMRVVDLICGALAQAIPERIPAASQGSMNNLAMGKSGPDGWDYYETLAGGMGAGPEFSGATARHSHMTNTLNTPVEVLERQYPLRLERYTVRRHSGGHGRLAGGDGIVRSYRFLQDASLSVISERRTHAPWGLNGGGNGKPGRNVLDGKELPAKVQLDIRAGSLLELETPGGGGYGEPD